jgi:uncharacterized membrane protein
MVEIITNFEKTRLKNIDAKQYFTVLIAVIFLTDLIILLNIPFLRQILGFFCFTLIPGLLILHVLKLNKIEFLKKFALSVGLSIAFLMFVGLLINSFYPIIPKPLSLEPILVSFNIILIIFAFLAYKRNKNDFHVKDIFNFKLDLKGKLTSPLIFPILFPFMAVFGTYLMNTQENNIILLVMLFLIPAYVVGVVYLRDRIPEATYPVAVLMIGVALCLMYGLRSNSVGAADSSLELYTFKLTLENFYWNVSKFYHDYNACLSVTVLPTLYKSLLGMEIVYIYKISYNLILSTIPLCVYLLFKKYMNECYAFLSSFLFMAQYTFISMLGWILFRQIISLTLFILAILVLFDSEINKLSAKRILFLIFMISVIVSHYSTAFLFFILIFLYWFVTYLRNIRFEIAEIRSRNITTGTVILCSAFLFFWYSQITTVPFSNFVIFIKHNFMNLANLSLESFISESVLIARAQTIPDKINVVVHNISFAFIAIGVLNLIKNRKNTKFDKEYLFMIELTFGLLVLLASISAFLTGYGPDRVYQQLLVFLAPAFVIGGKTISNFISRSSRVLPMAIILIVLVAQFFSATYMIYQICGVPYSEALNLKGTRYENFYVHDKDVAGAKWIYEHNIENLDVWSDYPGTFVYCQFNPELVRFLNPAWEIKTGYIYLRTVNTIKGVIYPTYYNSTSITNYSHLFINKNKIYANGGSEVYK